MDLIADNHFRSLNRDDNIEAYPADWSIGKVAGPMRNKQMVETLNKKTDRVIGFIYDESRGTRNCLNYALDAYLPVREVSIIAGLLDVKDYKRA